MLGRCMGPACLQGPGIWGSQLELEACASEGSALPLAGDTAGGLCFLFLGVFEEITVDTGWQGGRSCVPSAGVVKLPSDRSSVQRRLIGEIEEMKSPQ